MTATSSGWRRIMTQDCGAESASIPQHRWLAAAIIAPETRIITQRIEVRIGLGVVKPGNGHRFEYRIEEFECGFQVFQIGARLQAKL